MPVAVASLPVAVGVGLPWDVAADDAVAAIGEARDRHGDTFVVESGTANRDDLGMAQQLGWTPPSPVYLVRMLLARWRARSCLL